MIKDPWLRLYIGQKLKKNINEITKEDLNNIRELEFNSLDVAGNEKITYFKDILMFPNLEKITIAHMNINKIACSYFEKLEKLKHIELYSCRLCDIEPIVKNNTLKSLVIVGSVIDNITSINKLTSLETLWMNNVKLNNLEFLKDLNIKYLSLDKSIINNYNGIKYLTQLESLSSVNVNIPINFYNSLISLKKVFIAYEDYVNNIEIIQKINDKGLYKIFIGSIISLKDVKVVN